MGFMNTINEAVDTDKDGSLLDNVAGRAAALGSRMLPSQVSSRLETAGHTWGDEMTDLFGTRDQSAVNAGSHGDGMGGAARDAMDPGFFGDMGGRLGAAVGGINGAVLATPLGNPVGGGMVGSTAGALGGMQFGSAIDHQIEAVSHWVD